MLSDNKSVISRQGSENHDFLLKREALIFSMLQQRRFVNKAERPLSPCNNALIALQLRPCCNAKRPSRECREALTACWTCKNGVSRKQRRPYSFSISRKKKS